jgi:hypothetical protein
MSYPNEEVNCTELPLQLVFPDVTHVPKDTMPILIETLLTITLLITVDKNIYALLHLIML